MNSPGMQFSKLLVKMVCTCLAMESPYKSCLQSASAWLDHAEGASIDFMVASGGVHSEGYGHDGPGVYLGHGQTEAYLNYIGMTGLASVWAMARRRPI